MTLPRSKQTLNFTSKHRISDSTRSHQHVEKIELDYPISSGIDVSKSISATVTQANGRSKQLGLFSLLVLVMAIGELNFSFTSTNDRVHLIEDNRFEQQHGNRLISTRGGLIVLASAHIIMSKDDRGQNLVLTDEDGTKGKGKGKGGGHKLVISGTNLGPNRDSKVIVRDNMSDGDVVISGNSMVIPSDDGHIVLAGGMSDSQGQGGPPPAANLLALWMPFMSNRMGYRVGYRMMMPFYGGQFG